MDNILTLTIVTPEKKFYSGEVVEIVTENEIGGIGFLPNHVPMVTVLKPSVTIITEKDGKKLKVFTSSGILNINNNDIKLMCDAAEYEADIDAKRAEEAKTRAEMRLQKGDKDLNIDRAKVALMRSLMRLKTKDI
jgi:F-type H+-transporting ATPase subunit epsilon